MGLWTTHECWQGSYTRFHFWRQQIAAAAGMPALESMVGFGGLCDWEPYRADVLTVLLNHSDCEGEIAAEHCAPLADRLEVLAPSLHDEVTQGWTTQFVVGLRRAAAAGEPVLFR